MTDPIKRHYLTDQVEQRLIEGIGRGDYGDTLPGERVLCVRLAVSRPTLRRALTALAAQGWIKQQQGWGTRVLRRGESGPVAVQHARRVMFLSSHPLGSLSAGTMLTYDRLSQMLAQTDGDLGFVHCPEFRLRSFEGRLGESLKDIPADVRILHQAPEAVQRWFEAEKVPCIIMGSPAPGVNLPGIDTDFAPAVTHAMNWLKREDHSQECTLLLLPKLELAGHRAMVEGFIRAGGSPGSVLSHPVDDEALPAWLKKELVPRLRQVSGPTAVITGWARFTVGLITGLASHHGLRIPRDLSVVCLADDPVFDMMIPPVSRYRRPVAKYVQRLARLIEEVAMSQVPREPHILLMPDQVAGGTVGKSLRAKFYPQHLS